MGSFLPPISFHFTNKMSVKSGNVRVKIERIDYKTGRVDIALLDQPDVKASICMKSIPSDVFVGDIFDLDLDKKVVLCVRMS